MYALTFSNRSKLIVCLSYLLLLSGCASKITPPVNQQALTPSETASHGTDATQTAVDQYLNSRLEMVRTTIEARDIKDPVVLQVMRELPRHLFVPSEYLDEAYADHPLPIGFGQTISQPYIVAWMTELLEIKPGEKVLEIGTGSGYQAAVLASLGYAEVYSIEIVPELAESAAARLIQLGFLQVKVRQGDGYFGWPEAAPFDAIIVTAAPDHLPGPLVAQLKDGGRIVIPIGPPGGYQSLWKFVKNGNELIAYNLGGVSFVPFTGQGIQDLPADASPAPDR